MKLLIGLVMSAYAGRDTKVIGGSIVTAHSEPYILSMQRSGSHFCGASIISSSRGVCAAHCASSYEIIKIILENNLIF